jgi:hypothetical protein
MHEHRTAPHGDLAQLPQLPRLALSTLLTLLALLLAPGDPALATGAGPEAAADTALDSPWHPVAAGLELAVFPVGPAAIHVLRCDPEQWETVALAVSELGGPPRTARAWAEDFGLTAAINAGMYDTDLSTHIGYFRTGEHVNNPVWVQRGYRQAACFEPRDPDRPRFILKDLDAHDPAVFADRYGIVIQNLRLISKPGENRWQPDTRPWAEACLGEDDQGRMLWIYCRHPHSMHEFNEILLALPLGLVAAQHLEGGRQAQLWVAVDDLALRGGQPPPQTWRAGRGGNAGWPVPNVLGLRPRAAR